jgi:hypothetical protein
MIKKMDDPIITKDEVKTIYKEGTDLHIIFKDNSHHIYRNFVIVSHKVEDGSQVSNVVELKYEKEETL